MFCRLKSFFVFFRLIFKVLFAFEIRSSYTIAEMSNELDALQKKSRRSEFFRQLWPFIHFIFKSLRRIDLQVVPTKLRGIHTHCYEVATPVAFP